MLQGETPGQHEIRTQFSRGGVQCEIGELEPCAHQRAGGHCAADPRPATGSRGCPACTSRPGGARLAEPGACSWPAACRLEQAVRQRLDQLDTGPQRGAMGRDCSAGLPGYHALDGVPAVRLQVDQPPLSPAEATSAFVRLIAGLLAVVFRPPTAPETPRFRARLVAMFNFMRGEFAGQERAFGRPRSLQATEPSTRQQWLHLVEQQERCFQVFRDCSELAIVAWLAARSGAAPAEIERLRRIGCGPDGGKALDRNLSRPGLTAAPCASTP